MAKETTQNAVGEDFSWVLIAPHVTEKAAVQSGDGVYTFLIHADANKVQVKKAIQLYYKVSPEKVRVINMKPAQILGRNRQGGTKKAYKKAMVYLKKGDKIDFV